MLTIPTSLGRVSITFTPGKTFRLAKNGLEQTDTIVATIYGEGLNVLAQGESIRAPGDKDIPYVGAEQALRRALGTTMDNETPLFGTFHDRGAIRAAFATAWPEAQRTSVPVVNRVANSAQPPTRIPYQIYGSGHKSHSVMLEAEPNKALVDIHAPEPDRTTITLTREERDVLFTLMGSIYGDMAGPRGKTEAIYGKLKKSGAHHLPFKISNGSVKLSV